MNEQEQAQLIYERVYRGFAAQGWQPAQVDGTCFYRLQESGRKCAAGHLIDDKHYYAGLEGYGVVNYYVRQAIERSLGFSLTPSLQELVFKLQEQHDEAATSTSLAPDVALKQRTEVLVKWNIFRLTIPNLEQM